MFSKQKKKIIITLIVLTIINFAIIYASIKDSQSGNDPMYRFRERQAVTFISALTLGLTGLTALFIYLLKKKIEPLSEKAGFWLFSAICFFYLCVDEYSMAHEGMDEWVGSWFGKDIKEMNLDNLVIVFFGILAFIFCIYFKKVIFKNKIIIPFFAIGGICLIGTASLHSFERINVYYEVAEESFKIIGVISFFSAYLLAFLSFRDNLQIAYKK